MMGWATLVFLVLTLCAAALMAYSAMTVRVADDNWDVVGSFLLTTILAVITLILFVIWLMVR